MKYFLPGDLLVGKMSPLYLAVILTLSIAFLAATFLYFNKKDLSAAS